MKSQLSKTELLQIPLELLQTLKEGEVKLRINGVESLQLTIENTMIHVDFLQKGQLKALLELEAEIENKSILEKLTHLKNIAEKFKHKGFTITISYKGNKILTLGYETKPTISNIFTKTNAIEVNNLVELLRLI